jgi:hypothetical protein
MDELQRSRMGVRGVRFHPIWSDVTSTFASIATWSLLQRASGSVCWIAQWCNSPSQRVCTLTMIALSMVLVLHPRALARRFSLSGRKSNPFIKIYSFSVA